MAARFDRLRFIEGRNVEKDWLKIYRLASTREFPWDFTRALELALYRTYAVPSIGRLLAQTAEMTERTQKRYDDTALLLDAIVEHGFDSEQGRTAIRRINQMHGAYDISDDDMRYVLCTFVVVPKRWLDAFGWRPLSPQERDACALYYQTLGRHMGIKDIPRSYDEFERYLNEYEAAHFAWDADARRVSDATLELMASWYPRPLRPAVRKATLALLDEPLLRAFHYEQPSALLSRAVRGALRLRGRVVRWLPPRRAPHYARQNREIKCYPDGYEVADLGTTPVPGARGCPVRHLAEGTGE
ncbi:oxygenase MpaB family protein [Streptomyces sp. NPDC098781]|uniref:oxygenase MpaB family protein n=1 Tax=Streptomyces sp. NPDC098781 TaxID=3366097 RepID=UPI00381AE131